MTDIFTQYQIDIVRTLEVFNMAGQLLLKKEDVDETLPVNRFHL